MKASAISTTQKHNQRPSVTVEDISDSESEHEYEYEYEYEQEHEQEREHEGNGGSKDGQQFDHQKGIPLATASLKHHQRTPRAQTPEVEAKSPNTLDLYNQSTQLAMHQPNQPIPSAPPKEDDTLRAYGTDLVPEPGAGESAPIPMGIPVDKDVYTKYLQATTIIKRQEHYQHEQLHQNLKHGGDLEQSPQISISELMEDQDSKHFREQLTQALRNKSARPTQATRSRLNSSHSEPGEEDKPEDYSEYDSYLQKNQWPGAHDALNTPIYKASERTSAGNSYDEIQTMMESSLPTVGSTRADAQFKVTRIRIPDRHFQVIANDDGKGNNYYIWGGRHWIFQKL